MSNIRYCYNDEDSRITYYVSDESDKLEKINMVDKRKDKINHYYECYDCYDEELSIKKKLRLFKRDYTKWSDEIKGLYEETNYHNFNPKQYYNNNVMVNAFFKKYSTKFIKKLNIMDIGKLESSYMERTPNGGQIYLKETGLIKDCYGVDYSAYYPNIMGNDKLDFEFPIREGIEKKYTFEEVRELYLKKKLPFGYYNIKITSEHPDILKVFSFSSDDIYTHTQLKLALKYRNLYKIKFEMNEDINNCYVYNKKDIIKSTEIFGEWFKKIKEFKEKLPSNMIVKQLSSALWGYIIQFNRQYLTLDEVFERNDISRSELSDKKYLIIKQHVNNTVEIVDKTSRYKSNLARIKSFLTAFSRDKIARLVIDEKLYNKVIRTQTDGIVLSEPHDFSHLDYYPKPELKTSGDIFWVSVNEYYKQCDKCQEFYKPKYYKCCPECN
jgi:hypothetical protein